MSDIKYTELDFGLIKTNLKTYLKSQDKFKDYNFDGSSMSILLDILSYNTGYNAFYLNMVANEMFLDSASMKENVVSRAKHLAYTPRSVASLRAKIDFQVTFQTDEAASQIPTNFALSKNQEFYTNVNDSRYSFYPNSSVFFEKTESRTFVARNVELIEGKRLTHAYTVDTTLPIKQRYIIPNANVDTSTIRVSVKDSVSSTTNTTFLPNTDITLVKETSPVYFLQAYNADFYEITFGDNIIGKGVTTGNIISIEYIVSSGDGPVGASLFRTGSLLPSLPQPSLSLIAAGAISTATVILPAYGYSDAESIDSIKLLAPRFYESQNRAVTKFDYETLILKDVPIAESVRVWGGEENIPPEYGKVFCAIKPKTGTALNEEDKSTIINTFIRPRNLVSLEVIVTEPDYVGITLNTTINYNANTTTLSADAVKTKVLSAIQTYKTDNLNGFDSDFRFSKFNSYIDSSDTSIVSNITEVGIKYKFIPLLNSRNKINIQLNNQIDTGDYLNNKSSIRSSSFNLNNNTVYLSDDGLGKIFLYYVSSDNKKIVVNDSVGVVNYETGLISIDNLLISSIPNNQNYINFYIKPKYNDIIALKNQMILIEDTDINVTVIDISKLKTS